VDGFWATKSEDFGLIVRAVSFQDFQPMWSWSTNVTADGQTVYRQTDDMQSQYHALHYSTLRSKNYKDTMAYTDLIINGRPTQKERGSH